MPSLQDLLDAKRAAVAALEKKQLDRQVKFDNLAAARRAVETSWYAITGGVAIGYAAGNSDFHATLAAILDKHLTTKRDRRLLDEWKVEPPATPDVDIAPEPLTVRKARPRNQVLDIDLENVSGAELLQNIEQLEADAQRARKEEADAKRDVREANKALRDRDNHWRIKVGESVLAHAGDDDGFRKKLDTIFQKRVDEQHRPLLDRWRNANARDAAPPPADAHRGWKPKQLADRSWGASFPKSAGKPLPDELVGADIVVRTKGGDEWSVSAHEFLKEFERGSVQVAF